LGLLELHSEIQRHLAREAEKADKWNKIWRDMKNRKVFITSRQVLKEHRRPEIMKAWYTIWGSRIIKPQARRNDSQVRISPQNRQQPLSIAPKVLDWLMNAKCSFTWMIKE
jgi:hypothetical protein